MATAPLASVRFADDCIARLLEALDKSPYAGNTIVVLWNDHGWRTATKYVFDKLTLWEGATRVVLAISDPMNPEMQGRASYTPVSLMDLYPTIAELAGLPEPGMVDGRSFALQLEDPETIRPNEVFSTFGYGNHMIRQSGRKLIRYHDGSKEYYEMASDPWEYLNLSNRKEFEGEMAELELALDSMLKAKPVLVLHAAPRGKDYKNW